MNEVEKIKLARRAFDKGWDYETLKYGDDLYGKEDEADDVWEYVELCKKIGTDAFDEKFAQSLSHASH